MSRTRSAESQGRKGARTDLRINTCMYKYQAQVKVGGVWIRTIIHADNQLHAKLLAQYQYGTSNVPFAPIKIG